jgi:tritrans,polycis-undecaprenyl-diphosphate synthase [geranylgeranyl-diphosphate specific]
MGLGERWRSRLRSAWVDHLGSVYARHLERVIDDPPDHVAIIQDGNRRYARTRDAGPEDGHRAGAETTEQVLRWCREVGIAELTLYAFSTENFDRPPAERAELFDLFERKFHEFADSDAVHRDEVRIRTIGDLDRLPERVREAAAYADRRTRGYDQFTLNVALAYGGRDALLSAARSIARDAAAGELDSEAVDTGTVADRLYDRPVRDVDLIIRTGGDERTSNFLPWHASGNEAAAVFCAPYWPGFSRVDFLRCLRTYEHREASWRRTRAARAVALLRAFTDVELEEATAVRDRLRDAVPGTVDGADTAAPTAPPAAETRDGDPHAD